MAKYSEFSEEEKKQFVERLGTQLKEAMSSLSVYGVNTRKVATIGNIIRTIGGPYASEIVNKVSRMKDDEGKSIWKGGSLQGHLEKYSLDDDYSNVFGIPYGKDQITTAKLGSKDGAIESNMDLYGEVKEIRNLPSTAGTFTPRVSKTEQAISGFYDTGIIPKETPAAGSGSGSDGGGGSLTGNPMDQIKGLTNKMQKKFSTPKPNTDKVDALKAARDKQVRLSGAEGPYGYKGGYDQMVKDQAILKPTRLGQREADGGFRLRSAAERQARIREGQFDMQEPQRIVMENFRNRYGDGAGGSRLEQEMKQFQKDTGVKDPLKLESDTKNKEAVARDLKRAKERKEVLNRYRVKEPDPFGKEVAALNTEDRAKVMSMVREKEEEEKNKNSGMNNSLGK